MTSFYNGGTYLFLNKIKKGHVTVILYESLLHGLFSVIQIVLPFYQHHLTYYYDDRIGSTQVVQWQSK
jgi:predicted Mrr-cat superfamily restriction endonuclease